MIMNVCAAQRIMAAAIAGAAVIALALAAPSAPRSLSPLASTTTSLTPCTAADLGVWVQADWIEAASGTMYMPLEFTNLSGHTCTLHGFPHVSAIGEDGNSLGSPAVPDRADRAQTVRLAPGETGYAMLEYSDVIAGNCPPAEKATAFELRVYPPGQHQANHALWDFGTCSAGRSSVFMRVCVIEPGIRWLRGIRLAPVAPRPDSRRRSVAPSRLQTDARLGQLDSPSAARRQPGMPRG